jgi:MoxR-like ATPase
MTTATAAQPMKPQVRKTRTKAQNVLTIDTSLINKEEVFKMIGLAQATGLPLLLIGDPGVGKTKTVIDYAKAFLMQGVDQTDSVAVSNAKKTFMDKIYILETDEGTKSSEVKGMPDLEELFTHNRYTLHAPITEAEVVIINEVDKASSAIRNSLLGIMNERFLFNGKNKVPCKWKIFIATCNEIPKDEIGSPFWDRFILKTTVGRISHGEMVKYFDKGGKNYKETIKIGIPTKAEINSTTIPTTKLEKYLEVAYTKSTDRTLTFVPDLTKAVTYVWDISVDKALVKVAEMMIGKDASSELNNKIMSPELKALLTKATMLQSLNSQEEVDQALEEIETMIVGYAAKGQLDETQVDEIKVTIDNVLADHPLNNKGEEIESILENALANEFNNF